MKNRKLICIALILSLCFSSFAFTVNAEQEQEKGYISVRNYDSGQTEYYTSFISNNEVMVSAEDIAKIVGYDYSLDDSGICFSPSVFPRYHELINIDFYGKVKCYEKGFSVHIRHHNEKYYLPLEKLLYLTRAQWCVENNEIVARRTNYTVFNFVDENFQWIYDSRVTKDDLLMNGQSDFARAVETSVAFTLNDSINPLAFIPVVGALEMIDEQYEKAILQLSVDDMQFLDDYGQAEIEKIIKGSDFSQAKSYWDNAKDVADLPEEVSKFGNSLKEIAKWIDEASKTNKSIKFDKYNDLTNLAPTELKEISDKMKGISTALKAIDVYVNIHKVATRSKDWNNDFLEQIEILNSFGKAGNVFPDAKRIKKISKDLIAENEDAFSATLEQAIKEISKIAIDKFVDTTPFGQFKNIMYTSVDMAKVFDINIGGESEALAFSHMVNCFIRVEGLAFFESADSYLSAMKNYGQLKPEDIEHIRNSFMLLLRTNLRNKAYIYYLNEHLNNEENWVNSQQALDIKASIAKDYALILKLIETEKFDRFLIVDSFSNMYLDEYGAVRTKISSDMIVKGELPENTLTANENDIKQLKEMISNLWVLNMDTEYNYEKDSSEKIISEIILDVLYEHHQYFGLEKVATSYDNNTGYFKLPSNDIDWIAENIFNSKINHDINSSDFYYKDDYYYMEGGLGSGIWYETEIEEIQQLDDGRYNVSATISTMAGNELFHDLISAEKRTFVADLKVINGNRQWVFYNIKSSGKPESVSTINKDDTNGVYASKQGEWIYYSKNLGISNSGLYKINNDNTKKQQLSNDSSIRKINIKNEWIYYEAWDNDIGKFSIYKIKTDGTSRQKLCEDCSLIGLYEDKIYYSQHVKLTARYTTYEMDLNGNNNQFVCNSNGIKIIDDWIYYVENKKTCRINVINKEKQVVYSEFLSRLIGHENWIYYTESWSGIYRIHPDGSNKEQLVSGTIYSSIAISNNYLYYSSEGAIFRYSLNNQKSEKIVQIDVNINSLDVVGAWIYYEEDALESKQYKTRTDGTDRQLVD